MSEMENNELTAGKQSKEPGGNQKLKLLYLAKILFWIILMPIMILRLMRF